MPRLDYAHCSCCGRHRDVCGLLTRTRLCTDCSKAILAENIEGIATKSGPAYRRWARGMVRFATELQAEQPQTRS